MPFTDSQSGYRGRCTLGGLRRAAFWAAQGWPNLVLARAAKAGKRQERLKREEWALARAANPFALPQDAHHWATVAREQKGFNARTRTLRAQLKLERKDRELDTLFKVTKRPRGF